MKIKKKKTGRKQQLTPQEVYQLMQKAAQLHQAGEMKQAAVLFNKILKADPNHADALNFLGIIASQAEEYRRAEQYFRRAIKILPDVPIFHKNLGHVLKNLEKYDEAISCYQRILDIRPEPAAACEAHINIGKVLSKMDRHEEAIASFQRALEITPESAEIHNKMGCAYRDLGSFDEAIDHYQKALEINPGSVEALHDLATCKKFTSEDVEEVRRAEKLAEEPSLTEERKAIACFTLGKIYNDLKLYDKAFAQYQRGNAIRHRFSPFDCLAFADKVEKTIKIFTDAFFAKRKDFGLPTEVPVFIVGMPRSGTSLVEQIIASHSRAWGAGELTKISGYAHSLAERGKGYPDTVINLKKKTVRRLAKDYEILISESCKGDFAHVTDKMPVNFLYLGLIALLFPKARIVHCRRNPLDTCLSNFFQCFSNGNEQSYDLASIGEYYRQYDRLMTHWREVLPLPMHEVVYEELIEDPEKKARELIAFVGLDWEEECLSFHQSRRAVKTASAWQARQPIYKDSRDRWRRYENFLGPLIKRLERPAPADSTKK